MCGISGIIDFENDLSNENELIKKMNNTVAKRGPNGEGYFISKTALFGHRRLSIIDIDGGAQPMEQEFPNGKKVVITFNGEIYNYLELKKELQDLGHLFSSKSDTEVLLHCYLEWGNECPNKLNGIFAFAIWDERVNELFLCRDHMGVKPLFYAIRGSTIIFGSELKVLLAHPLVKAEVTKETMSTLCYLVIFRTPGFGVFKDVYEVKAAHYIRFNSQTKECLPHQQTRYWNLKAKEHTDDLDTTIKTIKEMFEKIVEKQMMTDNTDRLGFLCSGGLDSSGISAIAQQKQKDVNGLSINTFCIDFIDSRKVFKPDYLHFSLDNDYATMVANHIKSNHKEILIDFKEIKEQILGPMYAKDYPSWIDFEGSLMLLFREVKDKHNINLLLSGEASDELFSGYPFFKDPRVLDGHLSFPWAFSFQELIKNTRKDSPFLMPFQKFMSDKVTESLKDFEELKGESEMNSKQRRLSYQFLTLFMSYMLERKDRMSSYNGVEVRVPFTDYKFVEYVYNIPFEMKEYGGMEKGILRKALESYLPDEITYRKKSAYPFTNNGDFSDLIIKLMDEILKDETSIVLQCFEISFIKSLFNKARENSLVRSYLEYLISFHHWFIEYQVVFV